MEVHKTFHVYVHTARNFNLMFFASFFSYKDTQFACIFLYRHFNNSDLLFEFEYRLYPPINNYVT